MTERADQQPSRRNFDQAEILVEARAVGFQIESRIVLDSVDIAVRAGEIVTVVGLNGAGKSTLVRVLLGLARPDSGTVKRKPGLVVGFSPQHLHRDRTLPLNVQSFLTLSTPATSRKLESLLEAVGAGNILGHPLAAISGGEMQRVLLARALLREPELLVLDEPLAGVDIASQSDLYRLVADIRDSQGCGVLMVSHDLHLVMAATDRVVCLNRHVCCTGHPHSIMNEPEFAALFGPDVCKSLAVYAHSHDHRHDASGKPIPGHG